MDGFHIYSGSPLQFSKTSQSFEDGENSKKEKIVNHFLFKHPSRHVATRRLNDLKDRPGGATSQLDRESNSFEFDFARMLLRDGLPNGSNLHAIHLQLLGNFNKAFKKAYPLGV